MKPTLEDLWYSYLAEKRTVMSEEECEIMNVVVNNSQKLRNTFNHNQEELFEKYDDSLADLRICYEKDAFLKGINFATKFLFEAIQND